MIFQRRRSYNGVLTTLILIFIGLIVAGAVTRMIVFYILAGIEVLIIILIVVALFRFLAKTGQTTSKTRKSTYDILEGHEIKGITKDPESTKPEKSTKFCDNCGMKLEPGTKFCTNCGK
ncbi:MAG: zinc ribbon domain-containing protein [Candidatus Heimdallarchaeaceae archaeon]